MYKLGIIKLCFSGAEDTAQWRQCLPGKCEAMNLIMIPKKNSFSKVIHKRNNKIQKGKMLAIYVCMWTYLYQEKIHT